MQCKQCFGRGLRWTSDEDYGPCPQCHGFGIISCCDTDLPSADDRLIDPPVTRSKVNHEVYFVPKMLATGYEMPFSAAPPDTLQQEIIDLILKYY
jgi:hypothetical protein